ncbi:restriction endonuclease subunit S [Corynebacterium mastitidis]
MNAIDTSTWGEFHIGELFHIIKGTRLKSTDRIAGEIPYVGASQFNNGVTHFIANDEHLHPGNVLTVCYNGPVGTTFYQPNAFWATDDVNILYPREKVSKEALLFATPIIQKKGTEYAYTNKWKLDDMKCANIRLPAAKSGKPDWEYMKYRMQKIIEIQSRKI